MKDFLVGRALTLGWGGTRYLGATMMLVACIGYSHLVRAEIYRWTDENGRVHFSDRPPANIKAEDISATSKGINVDESLTERNKLNKVFAPETPEEKHRRQAQEHHAAQQLANQCHQAKDRLNRLQRRMVMVDENGKAYDISEAERKAMVEELRAQIKARCS